MEQFLADEVDSCQVVDRNVLLCHVPGLRYNFGVSDPSDQDEVKRMLNVLRTSIRLLGLTNREIERRLGLTPSYVSRLFAGAIELKVEHVVAIARAMGLQPWEFFELAYPRRSDSPSEPFRAIRGLLRDMQPASESAAPPQPAGFTAEEIEEKIQVSVRKVLRELAGGK
jgi:transcriptional regulator with XRE-family HTH domain